MRFSRATSPRAYVVVSVGGSLLVPDAIDTNFLCRFRDLILEHIAQGFSFYVVVGGGKIARRYQEAATTVLQESICREDQDWLGIHATRMNAHLMRTLFKDHAQARIVKNPAHHLRGHASVIIGAGWRPGWSTDYCATRAAIKLGAKKVVNLSNIDYVYDKDPKKYADAIPIEKIDWATFRTLIPDRWDPGLSSPFDPVAAEHAHKAGLEVAILNGNKLEEFAHYLKGKPFIGTVIS